jgi:hypothetical protein
VAICHNNTCTHACDHTHAARPPAHVPCAGYAPQAITTRSMYAVVITHTVTHQSCCHRTGWPLPAAFGIHTACTAHTVGHRTYLCQPLGHIDRKGLAAVPQLLQQRLSKALSRLHCTAPFQSTVQPSPLLVQVAVYLWAVL